MIEKTITNPCIIPFQYFYIQTIYVLQPFLFTHQKKHSKYRWNPQMSLYPILFKIHLKRNNLILKKNTVSSFVRQEKIFVKHKLSVYKEQKALLNSRLQL